ncbi:RNA polymerase sigma factor [Pedobacter alpinus]|uniref:RNA polymerase sigma factor n=1 Tax=Pedobacter alpinus TaxID=1590643 RepID=A0ABW5TPH9_9SPHI
MATIPEKNSSLSDEHLVAKYKKSGDLQVLGSLYKDYMPLVYGVCLKYFKEPELSKDAVMQIFEQLIEKLKNHEVKNFKSWLYVLSRNFCLMELRKSKKMNIVNIDDNFVESAPLLHHDDNDTKEAQLVLMEKCIETLTEEQKWSVKLFYLQQKCYTQVADVTGYDLKKVKSYIQNGKRNLKICIEKNGE